MNNKTSSTKATKVKLFALAGAAALTFGAGTMALLTDTSVSAIEITSASLGLTVNSSVTGAYTVVMDTANLKPSDSRSGTITLKNDSTIPATVNMTKTALTGFTSTVKDSLLADFTTTTLQPNEEKTLTLTVELPSSITAPPATQTLSVTFDAAQ